MKKLTAILFVSLFATGVWADAAGDALAKKSYDLTKPKDASMTATMTLTDKNGAKKTRKLEMFTQETEAQSASFTRFLEPADVAGTRFLTITKKGGDSDQRIYLPALKKVRKIAASGKDGDFVNSDLSYYDLEDREYGDSEYTLLAQGEKLPAFEGRTFNKLQLVSKDKNSPYSKSIVWLDATDSFIYRVETYGKDGTLWKIIQFPKVEEFKGCLLPVRTEVENRKKGSKTVLEMTNITVNTGLKASLFSEKSLEQ